MGPAEVVRAWVAAFNAADIDGLAALYAENAVNDQVAYRPLTGRAAIVRLFEMEFARATMVCVPENLIEAGEWAVLEWSDPLGMRGCGFFRVVDGAIVLQRGYFDRLAFYAAQGIGVEEAARTEAVLAGARDET